MGYIFDVPPVLYVDNTGAIALSKHRTSCKYSRHVTRRDLKVREYVAASLITVEYVPTAENLADIFTKHLNRETFTRLASRVLGCSSLQHAKSLGPCVPDSPIQKKRNKIAFNIDTGAGGHVSRK